jgi:hypothetical protein
MGNWVEYTRPTIIFVKGSFFHGHDENCTLYNSECPKRELHLKNLKSKKDYCTHLVSFYKLEGIVFEWEYFEQFDCNYDRHVSPFYRLPRPNKFDYDNFLQQIYAEKIQGYVVLRGLSIKRSSRSQFHGFVPIKTNLSQRNWSSVTRDLCPNLKSVSKVVVGVHQTSDLGNPSFFLFSLVW